MSLVLEDMQKTRLRAVGISARGNETDDLVLPLAWSSSNEGIVALSNADGQEIDASAVGPVGFSKIEVTGKNGAGEDIPGVLDIDIKAGPTASIRIDAGIPEDI